MLCLIGMGEKTREDKEAASDIFKNLFGNSNEENRLPLFSDNPYRRKSQPDIPPQPTLGLGSVSQKPSASDGGGGGEEEKNPGNLNSLPRTDFVEPKKRERGKERESTPDSSDSETEQQQQKKKKSAFDDVSMEKVDEEDGIRKKKKRKRDEIEEEHEARKYGGAIEGELTRSGPVVGEKRKTANDSADMVVSKEGYDDESKLQRTVFVGNLPFNMKNKALLKEFKQFGEIDSVRIRSVPILDSKLPGKGAKIKGKVNDSVDSVNAYIVFKEKQSAQAALSHNMTKVGDKHIRVDRACPPRKKLKGDAVPLYDNKKTVFIGSLPFDVKEEELYQLFCGVNQLGPSIEAIQVIRDPSTSLGKGIAYVLFKTRDAANLVMKRKSLKLRDHDLRLSHARPDSTPSKRKNPVPTWRDSAPDKRYAVDSTDRPSNSGKPKVSAAALSHQGLRASKSGVQKKVNFRPRINEHSKLESNRQGGPEPKVHKTKRPTVAARKAKEKRQRLDAEGKKVVNAGKSDGGAARQTGKKRKLENGIPENSHGNKKARNCK